ncbi:hypothetical protein EDC01DRAFT_641441 [Geopyxis carbonaria]|nr:hypothetical protein EDC01DRAFT_641441 [Geopyxis carbonaria]
MNLTAKSLLLILPLLAAANANAPAKHAAEDLICHAGAECYPRLFEATKEFQTVHADQDIPAGLHVRLNLETGLKEAKLYNASEDTDSNAVLVVDPESEPESVDAPAPAAAPKEAIKPPKPAAAAVGDAGVFATSGAVLSQGLSAPPADALTALTALEDIAHEIYWGVQLASTHFLTLLDLATLSPHPGVRASAALVLGSACSNNNAALDAGLKSLGSRGARRLVGPLAKALDDERDEAARLRVLFALAQVLKSEAVRAEFVRADGLAAVVRAAEGAKGALLKRLAVLVEDAWLNSDMRSEAKPPGEAEMALRGLCAPFEAAVVAEGEDEDTKERVASALLALMERFGGCPGGRGAEVRAWVARVVTKAGGKTPDELVDAGEMLAAYVVENKARFDKFQDSNDREL